MHGSTSQPESRAGASPCLLVAVLSLALSGPVTAQEAEPVPESKVEAGGTEPKDDPDEAGPGPKELVAAAGPDPGDHAAGSASESNDPTDSSGSVPQGTIASGPLERVAPRVEVIGNVDRLRDVAGTATVITSEELEISRPFTTSEALRKAPAVNVRDEEGIGLRPNIGIRGLNPSRSTRVLLLEDGIPLSYAPYGDNASYYHPPIDRFERIDVLKGAEQIRFGPQTAGGLINYITPLPTKEPSGMVSLSGGNRDYLSAHARLSRGPVLIDYIYKQADGSRDNIHAQLNDFNVKGVFDLTSNQALTLRANYYSENSDMTYSGLTDAEYRNFGPEYNPFSNDTFDAYRVGASATHELRFNADLYMLTNLYGAYFNRDWWRQSSTTTDTQCGTAFTNARLAGLPVDPNTCNSTQGRLRSYWTYGIEPRLYANFRALGAENQMEVAVKAHFETQDREQQNANSPNGRSGTIVENNDREVDAYSAFIQNRFIYGPFSVTPGVRYEYMNFKRTNHLAAGGQGLSGSTSLSEWIPGVGLTYNPTPTTTLYAGWHRGFSPPRVEDVINNTTLQSVDVDPDDADEWEIGVRSAPRPGIRIEAAYFRNDFSTQTVVGNIAGGTLPLATGAALYEGLDLSGRVDFGPLLRTPHNVYMRLAYMWLPTAEITSAFRAVDTGQPIQGNVVGNRLPYAPDNLVNFGIGYSHPIGFTGELEFVYTDKQYSDFANTATPPVNGNGQVGILDSYTVINLALNYSVPGTGFTAYFTIKNLADEQYIADRTRGILPGTPRLYQAGVQYRF